MNKFINPTSSLEMWLSLDNEIFPGFYNSYLSPENLYYIDEENNEESFWNEFNFEEYKNSIAKKYIEEISKVFKVIDWNIFSPNTYNYQNDNLNILIEFSLDEVFERLQSLDFNYFLGSCDFEEVLNNIIYYSLDYNEEKFIVSLKEL